MQRAFKLSQSVSRTAFKTCVASAPKVNASSFATFTTASATAASTTSGSFGDGLVNNPSKNTSVQKGNINNFRTTGLPLLVADGDDDDDEKRENMTIKKGKSHFRILSLDGGGVRSIIECVLLKRIIEVYPTFLDNIDLITGASAGGILSLCLATGKNVDEADAFFKTIVPEIFKKSWIHEISSLDSAIAPAYTNNKLKEVLIGQFGDIKLSDLPKKVLIPSFQLDNHSTLAPNTPTTKNDNVKASDNKNNGECNSEEGECEKKEVEKEVLQESEPVSAKFEPEDMFCDDDEDFEVIPRHHGGYGPDHESHRRWAPRFFHNLKNSRTADHLVVDVCLRTSAAPTYFPIYQGFVDGGVYANNPSLCGVTSAINSGIKLDSIAVLSLSTGRDGKFVSPEQYGSGEWGLAQWAPTLIDMLLDSNVEISDFQCAQLLGQKYHRVDPLLTQNINLDQPKFIPLLEEIASKVDLTDTIEWIQNYWFNKSDNIKPIFTPTCTPSYSSPTLQPRYFGFKGDSSSDEEDVSKQMNEKLNIEKTTTTVTNGNTTTTTTEVNASLSD
ncbi:hypothetical protein DICPUDRAFT_156147 [Dictyostelium purpureum]|uniref:PNPLA domain-containing protein n=1 Tax=Dictyostelium purpureum TaxID=5786 RepID=F0ZVU6_DICPU|nr:uncharacterized protein DICPUDRAFT_156147 [Dictyostelium purpureum]EGC31943.1 hypothetical protein DICPUDRAFT_156147 [Dictyostelium purpureum]|eukprot:XP_003291545.1 hypothetical protein DICPUDRAFT_156147 [Dictyostelium purpureum]